MNMQSSLIEYLNQSALFWACITLGSYLLAVKINAWLKYNSFANPMLIGSALALIVVMSMGANYQDYMKGGVFFDVMLPISTVALAVSLYRNRKQLHASAMPIVVCIVVMSVFSIVCAVLTTRYLGGSEFLQKSAVTKSATSGIAIGIAPFIGADATLSAALIIFTGVVAAIILDPIMALLNIKSDEARGFALGLSGHGAGTARAFQISQIAGTFAGLALVLNGVATAIIAPVLVSILF